MTGADYATWLTKAQAAEAIGVSTKTIEKLAADRRIEQAVYRRPTGGPPIVVFHPDDVARIAQERRTAPAPFVLPADPTSRDQAGNGNGHGRALAPQPAGLVTPSGEDVLRLVFAAALRALSAEKPATSESSEKPVAAYVAKAEALALSGLSATELRKAVQAGEVTMRGRRYRRKDLEAL